jgi:hypothetical protein
MSLLGKKTASVFISALLTTAAAALTLAPQPLPPVNWEVNADERFEPRVERVAIDMTLGQGEWTSEAIREAWQGWGPEAFGYIERLLEQERWNDFKRTLKILLYNCPFEEGRRQMIEDIKSLADVCAAESEGSGPCNEFRAALGLFVFYQQEGVDDLLHELAVHPGVRVRSSAAYYFLAEDHRDTAAAMAIIDDLAEGDETARREAAELLMRASLPDACERAEALAATVSEDLANRIRERCDHQQSFVRAQEPMAKVLEREER